MKPTYFPYPIVDSPAQFGLQSSFEKTHFGRIHFVHSKKQASQVATVFLHGIDDDWRIWTPLLQAAQQEKYQFKDIFLFDIPGFGKSENLTDELDPNEIAALLVEITAKYGYSQLRLVGHSMGGFLVLDTAARFPEKVTEVISLAGTHISLVEVAQQPLQKALKFPWISSIYWTMKVASNRPRINQFLRSPAQMRRVLRPLTARPEAVPEAILTYFAKTTKSAFTLAAKVAHGYDVQASWERLSMPILAIFGRYDRLVPVEDGERVVAILPHATTKVIEDAGHWPQLEVPHEVLALLR